MIEMLVMFTDFHKNCLQEHNVKTMKTSKSMPAGFLPLSASASYTVFVKIYTTTVASDQGAQAVAVPLPPGLCEGL